MSAYLLTDREFSAIYTALDLRRQADANRHLFRYQKDSLTKEMPGTRELVESWQHANAQAVAQRYREPAQDVFQPIYTSTEGAMLTDAKLYGCLSCLIYQCSEGDVPETDAYKMLESLYTAMAHRLALTVPGADTWGLR